MHGKPHTLSPGRRPYPGGCNEFRPHPHRLVDRFRRRKLRFPISGPAAHGPGPITLMGRTFPPGEARVEALSFLANHPATHHELAAKLARHFIADAPVDGDVPGRLRAVLCDTRSILAPWWSC